MKIFLLFLAIFTCDHAFGQITPEQNTIKLEKQISFAKENKPHSYYVKQAELWWNEVQKDLTSETSWYNYYRACRSAQGTYNWKEDFVKESPALKLGDDIVKLMEKYIPNTFTFYYVKGSTGGVNPEAGSYLMKAYAINPNFDGIHSDVVTYAQSILDHQLRAKANKEWYQKNDMSPGLLAYGYNLLMSVDAESILLTQHDNDSYPVWMLQDVLGIRKNVKVINIDFLIHQRYREKVFKDLNISQTDLPGQTINEWEDNWKTIVAYILSNYKGKKPLYVSLTLSLELYKNYLPKLFTSGLALYFSEKPVNVVAKNMSLIENVFLLDYIKRQVINETNVAAVNLQNLNYLKSLKITYDYFKKRNQLDKTKQIRTLSLLIAEKVADKKILEDVRSNFK